MIIIGLGILIKRNIFTLKSLLFSSETLNAQDLIMVQSLIILTMLYLVRIYLARNYLAVLYDKSKCNADKVGL